MRQAAYIFFAIAIVAIGYHAYKANAALNVLQSEASSVSSSLDKIKEDNEKLESDIEYFSNSINLEKELRARFNYRAPNEKLIIVVPKKAGE